MKPPASMLDVIHRHALAAPDREAFRYLADRRTERARVSFAGLLSAAQSWAGDLRDRVTPGARVPLVFTPGLSFIAGLLACWQLRAVAVPLAPESFRRGLGDRRHLLRRLDAPCVLCDETTAPALRDALALPCLTAPPSGQASAGDLPPPVIDPHEAALLQFTSGSTAAPRGVVITHGNLMANMAMIRDAFGHDERSTVVAWAPLYHDQGLIGNVLQPLYLGSRCVLFSPQSFVRDPLSWLEIVSDARAHTSGGPNFAYDLCAARFNATRLEGIDLSSWRIAFNGAEPVRPETVARFSERFAPYGFDARSMFPCYGLAESTLFVSGGPGRRAPLAKRAEATCARSSSTPPRTGCGRPPAGTDICIVDPQTWTACRPLEVGEIWISGDHVARGYWDDDEGTRERFLVRRADAAEREYLRTGDLGFVDEEGELFPTGRLKELIIQDGRNFAPEDVERTIAAASEALDPYRGVVFSVDPGGNEHVVAVHEIRRTARHDAAGDELVRSIRRRVSAAHGLTLHRVILVPQCTIALTTSGKKRRAQVRAEYLAGTLPTIESHETPV